MESGNNRLILIDKDFINYGIDSIGNFGIIFIEIITEIFFSLFF